jgi:hypothetical protein
LEDNNNIEQASAVDPDLLINEVRVQTLGELAHFYAYLEPGKAADAFATEFFHPMGADPSISGERFRAEFVSVLESGAPADLKFAAMTIACAYCVDVSRLLARGKRELAWQNMSEARYWCGVTLASRGIEDARSATISATRKHTGRQAAAKRVDDRLAETKNEAFRLARAECPPGRWKSRRAAALAIKDKVIAFSAEDGRQKLVNTDSGGQQTVYDWLAEMPDAAELFNNWGTWARNLPPGN